jgi:hypothetical protein
LTITDEKGRVLTLHAPGDPLLTLDMLEAAGRDGRGQPVLHLVTNQGWIGMANVACHVEAIDGVPEPLPTNVPQIRSLIAKLGQAGMKAVAAAISETADAGNADTAKN